METDGVPLWLMGGWGVDALLGTQTREHHDLDVLVELSNLRRFRKLLEDDGFSFQFVWDDENWWVPDNQGDEPQPTAFVHRAADGREVDTHVIRRTGTGVVETLWTAPYALTEKGLGGKGTVAAQPLRCLTAELQRVTHTGYELPPHHIADLRKLSE